MRLLLLLLLARNLLSDDLMAGAGRNWILRDSDTRAPVSEWAGQCSSESERRDRLDPAVRNSDRNDGWRRDAVHVPLGPGDHFRRRRRRLKRKRSRFLRSALVDSVCEWNLAADVVVGGVCSWSVRSRDALDYLLYYMCRLGDGVLGGLRERSAVENKYKEQYRHSDS